MIEKTIVFDTLVAVASINDDGCVYIGGTVDSQDDEKKITI